MMNVSQFNALCIQCVHVLTTQQIHALDANVLSGMSGARANAIDMEVVMRLGKCAGWDYLSVHTYTRQCNNHSPAMVVDDRSHARCTCAV